MTVEEWLGVFAAAGTPAATIAKLNAAINESLKNPDTAQRPAGLGLAPAGRTLEDFLKTIAADTQRWSGIVKASGFKAD